ncbi:MAG: hypothetical protein ACYTFT_16305, partial [Planctomycetota bacterium]
EAVVLTNLRSKALLPRVFVGTDRLASTPPEELASAVRRLSDRHGLSTIAFNQGKRPERRLAGLRQLREFRHERSREFVAATRNPVNRNWRETLHVLSRDGESAKAERDQQQRQGGAGHARQTPR